MSNSRAWIQIIDKTTFIAALSFKFPKLFSNEIFSTLGAIIQTFIIASQFIRIAEYLKQIHDLLSLWISLPLFTETDHSGKQGPPSRIFLSLSIVGLGGIGKPEAEMPQTQQGSPCCLGKHSPEHSRPAYHGRQNVSPRRPMP